MLNLLGVLESEELAEGLMCADPLTRRIVRCIRRVIVLSFEVHILVHVKWGEHWDADEPLKTGLIVFL